MFGAAKVVGASVIGTADNCSVFFREKALEQFSYAAFLMPGETAYILLKSVAAEYCFTDVALVLSQGTAVGRKRDVRRFDYAEHMLTEVAFETSGVSFTDLDSEIKLRISGEYLSIDIKKAESAAGIAAYRAVLELSRTQARNNKKYRLAVDSLARSLSSPVINTGAGNNNAANGREGEGVESAVLAAQQHVQMVHALVETFNPVSYKDSLERLTPSY